MNVRSLAKSTLLAGVILLATLTSEEKHALRLSAEVALPILRRLVANADAPLKDYAVHAEGAAR